MRPDRTTKPLLPRWFGPRASVDNPAVRALIDRVGAGARWADIGGEFNLNIRLDLDPPVVLRVNRPWTGRSRVVGLRRLRERLAAAGVRVARPLPMLDRDVVRVSDRWAELEELVPHAEPAASHQAYLRLFEELGRLHGALRRVWADMPDYPRSSHGRTIPQPDIEGARARYWLRFTRRRLGPASESVVRRAWRLHTELSAARVGVELPRGPIHGDYKLGNAVELPDGSWCSLDLDFVAVRERLCDVAGSLYWALESGLVHSIGELIDTYERAAPARLTAEERRLLPALLARIPLYWVVTAGLTEDLADGVAGADDGVPADGAAAGWNTGIPGAEAAMDRAERLWFSRPATHAWPKGLPELSSTAAENVGAVGELVD